MVAKQYQDVDLPELLALLPDDIDIGVNVDAAEDALQALPTEGFREPSPVSKRCRCIGAVRSHPIERCLIQGLTQAIGLEQDEFMVVSPQQWGGIGGVEIMQCIETGIPVALGKGKCSQDTFNKINIDPRAVRDLLAVKERPGSIVHSSGGNDFIDFSVAISFSFCRRPTALITFPAFCM